MASVFGWRLEIWKPQNHTEAKIPGLATLHDAPCSPPPGCSKSGRERN